MKKQSKEDLLKFSKEDLVELIDYMQQALEYKDERINKIIEMFKNDNLNKYYYGMSYEFAINDFKEDVIKLLRGEDNER